jgi:lipoprotein
MKRYLLILLGLLLIVSCSKNDDEKDQGIGNNSNGDITIGKNVNNEYEIKDIPKKSYRDTKEYDITFYFDVVHNPMIPGNYENDKLYVPKDYKKYVYLINNRKVHYFDKGEEFSYRLNNDIEEYTDLKLTIYKNKFKFNFANNEFNENESLLITYIGCFLINLQKSHNNREAIRGKITIKTPYEEAEVSYYSGKINTRNRPK